MGGMGSGRRRQFMADDTTDDYRRVDVRHWQREGILHPGSHRYWQWCRNGAIVASIQVKADPGKVTLIYRHRYNGGEWENLSYPVSLEWMPCNYGGLRPWFRCPARGCGRRCAILYVGKVFACRQCYRLAYPNQRETDDDRAARRAERIRDKLGWEPGILNGEGWKPKGMHWRTFKRLTAQHNAFAHASLISMAGRLNILGESLDDWV